MYNEDSVEIAAPPQLVWDVFSDVEHWPDWTSSVTSLVGLDAPALAVGRRFAIKQPGMSKLVWTVTRSSRARPGRGCNARRACW
jgi:uncharacterized membrane protein